MEYPKLVAIAGYAIEFYYKAGDEKLSFRVKGSETLTEKLLKNCKTKRINPLDISHCISGIKKKIVVEGIFEHTPCTQSQPARPVVDYTTELNLLVQKKYGQSITTEVVSFNSTSTTVRVHTPFGDFEGVGKNKVIAKAIASQKALEA